MLKELKKRLLTEKGVISIELMLVTGVIVVLVVVSMNLFSYQAMKVNNTIGNAIENAQNHYAPSSP